MDMTKEIEKMICAANALGAPLFSLGLLKDGLAAIENDKETATGIESIYTIITGKKDLPEHNEAAEVLWKAAEVAFAFACNCHIPYELAAYRNRDDANEILCMGIREARKWLEKK